MIHTQHIGFGGGCHWCTEAVFESLKGTSEVEQGFARSEPPYDQWSEAARLLHDPSVIPLKALIAVHLHTHSSTSDHPLRQKYRSAVYVTSQEQGQAATQVLSALQADWEKPLVTKVLALGAFKLNAPEYLRYYATRPDAPFCRTHISPKLAKLRRQFSHYLKDPG